LICVLHPVGPLPASVYWRRRGIALGVVLLALVSSWLLVGGGGAGKPGGGSGVAGASPSGTPDARETLAASGPAGGAGGPGAGAGGTAAGGSGAAGGGAVSGGTGAGAGGGSGGAGGGGGSEGGAGAGGAGGSVAAGAGPGRSGAAGAAAGGGPGGSVAAGAAAGGGGAGGNGDVAGGGTPGPCPDGVLRLTVAAAKPAYRVGARPVLSLTVRNVGPAACVKDLAASQQEVLLYAGSTRLWSSNDCYPGGGTDLETIAPAGQRTYPVTWSGLSSRPGCPAPRTRVPAGRYTLTARIGTLHSTPGTLTLT
jgi:hypothetical protein